MDLNKLNKDARIVFLLLLTQLVQDKLVDSEGYELALEALQHCWDWVLYKNIKAFDLYYYLGNDDGNDVTTFSLLLGQQEEEKRTWTCVDVVLSITIQNAFELENQRFVPEDIESLYDEEEMNKTLECFWDSFTELYKNTAIVDKLFAFMIANYPNGSDKRIYREDLKTCFDLISCS